MKLYDVYKDGEYLGRVEAQDLDSAIKRANQFFAYILDDDLLEVVEVDNAKI